jgi:serine/threonine-protein phosphatase 2B catalytic subunit
MTVYEACLRAFQALPLAAILDNRFFCVHGGLSPELETLADLERVRLRDSPSPSCLTPHHHRPSVRPQISRFEEPASHGLLCDLLWSDPIQNYGHEHEETETSDALPHGTLWVHNAMRGCSFNFTCVVSSCVCR